MNDNIVDFVPKKETVPSPVGTATGGDVMTVTTQVRIPRRVRVIKRLHEGEYKVWPVDIAEDEKPFGIQITDESCICCGGFFPMVGEIRGFWDEDRIWTLVHIGCLVQVGDWVQS